MWANWYMLVALTTLLYASPAFAQQMESMDSSTAAAYGRALSARLSQQEGLPVDFDADPQKAVGLSADSSGIIFVPKEDLNIAGLNPAAGTDPGAPLGYLFTSPRFSPLVEDNDDQASKTGDGDDDEAKQDDEESANSLCQVELMGPDGRTVTVTALVLTARYIAGDGWRLYGFGTGKTPLVDARCFDAEEQKRGTINLHVQDIADEQATLMITLFGQHEAPLHITFKDR